MSISDYIIKPLVSGAVGYGLSKYLYGNFNVNSRFISGPVSLHTVIGSAIVVGSLFSEITQDNILSHIDKNNRPLASGTAILSNLGSTAAAIHLLNSGILSDSDFSVVKLAGISAAAEVGGQYLYRNWISPFTN